MSEGIEKAIAYSKSPFVVVLVLALAIRLILMPIFTSNIDMKYWVDIVSMSESGFGLYDVNGYFYTPIWGYIVDLTIFVAKIFGLSDMGTYVPEFTKYIDNDYAISPYVSSIYFNIVIKIPLIIVDIIVGIVLYKFVLRHTESENKALFAMALWLLSPLVILESSVHGMFDNISAGLLLLTIIFTYERKYFFAGVFFSLAILTKFFPIFLGLFLIASVLKREGVEKDGLIKLTSAIVGGVIAFILVELPAILAGKFWESLYFITSRVGVSTNFLNSFFTPTKWILLFVAIGLIVAIAYFLHLKKGEKWRNALFSMNAEDRNKLAFRGLGILAVLSIIGVLIFSFVTLDSHSASVADLFSAIGMKFVLILMIFSILVEIFIAYKIIFAKEYGSKEFFTAAMLSSVAIFLWPPAPQYVIVFVPMVVLYISIVNKDLLKPYIIFSILMGLYEIILGNIPMIYSFAIYTNLISLDTLIPMTDILTSYIAGIPFIGLFMAVFGTLAYLSVLYILFSWIIRNKEVILS